VHTRVQRLVSVVKMATVLEVCPSQEQRSIVFFVGKGRDIHKKHFLFTVGSVCSIKPLKSGARTVENISLMKRLKRRC
jgi:hypothetical protein